MTVQDCRTPTARPTPQWVYFDLEIINNGTTAIPLSQLTVRYWYTSTIGPPCRRVTRRLPSATTRPDALRRVARASRPRFATHGHPSCTERRLTTSSSASRRRRAISPPAATAGLQLGFHKNDWSNFTRTERLLVQRLRRPTRRSPPLPSTSRRPAARRSSTAPSRCSALAREGASTERDPSSSGRVRSANRLRRRNGAPRWRSGHRPSGGRRPVCSVRVAGARGSEVRFRLGLRLHAHRRRSVV